jgi:negative regulator of replication initiation
MPSQNVRISESAYQILRQLAELEQTTMQAALDRVLEEHRRKVFLKQANAAFAALKADAKAWKEEQVERELWDKTLVDGAEI